MEQAKIDLLIEGGAAAKTLGELRDNARAVEEALEGAEIGSEQYNKLNQQLINTNKQVKNLELGFEALDSEQVASEIGSVAGAIGDVATGLVLVSGGNKSLEEMAHRIETALGVSMALKGAIEGAQSARKLYNDALARGNALSKVAITLQKTFNKVIKSNLFIALAAGIAAVALAFSDFFKSASASEQIQNELNEAIEAGATAAGKEEGKLKTLTVALFSAAKGTQARVNALKSLNDVIPDSIGYITEETIATGEAITMIKEYLKVVKQRAELAALEQILSEKIAERLRLELELRGELTDLERIEIQGKIQGLKNLENATLQMTNAGQQNLNNLEGTNEALAKGQQPLKDRTTHIKENTAAVVENTDANDEAEKQKELAAQKEADRLLRIAEQEEALATRKQNAQDRIDQINREKGATDFELKIIQLTEQHQAEMDLLAEFIPEENELRLELQAEYEERLLDIEAEAAAQRKAQTEEEEAAKTAARQQSVNSAIDGAKSLASIADSLNTLFHKKELDRIKQKQKAGEKLTKAEEKRLKKEEAIQKAFVIAKLAIDTATAISGIIAASTAGDPYTYAARVAAGIASILAGMATAYDALGGGSAPSSVSANVPSTIEDEDNNQTSAPIIDEFETGSSLLNDPQKVFVVESDITNVQNNVASIEDSFTYG